MQKPSLVLAATTLILLASTAVRADVNATAEMCNGCHGDNGVSQWNDVPTIAGIDAFVHSDALYVYRDEARPCAMSEFRAGDMTRSAIDMCNVVKEMSDDEIDEIAEHYAALPFVPAKQEFDAALAAAGEACTAVNAVVATRTGVPTRKTKPASWPASGWATSKQRSPNTRPGPASSRTG